ncbi:DUF6544 family protein [Halocola ammonii]
MLKFAFLFLLLIHGGIHLLGFFKAQGLARISEISLEIPRSIGWLWLIASLLFFLTALVYLLKWPMWWTVAIAAVILSQVLIIFSWQDAKFGTVLNLIFALIIAVGIGQWNFHKRAQSEVNAFLAEEANSKVQSQKNALPELVEKWIETCSSKKNSGVAKFDQRGKMKTSVDGSWKEFTAKQWSSLVSPEFFWTVDVGSNSFMQFNGLDKLIENRGSMKIHAYGLLPVVNSSGEKTDEASAIRYLAETVWYPESVKCLPLEWDVLSDDKVEAALTNEEFSVSGVFTFNKQNLPIAFEAMRFNDQTGQPEKWHVEIDPESYFEVDGAMIPARAQISWQLDKGKFTWYQVEVLNRITLQ